MWELQGGEVNEQQSSSAHPHWITRGRDTSEEVKEEERSEGDKAEMMGQDGSGMKEGHVVEAEGSNVLGAEGSNAPPGPLVKAAAEITKEAAGLSKEAAGLSAGPKPRSKPPPKQRQAAGARGLLAAGLQEVTGASKVGTAAGAAAAPRQKKSTLKSPAAAASAASPPGLEGPLPSVIRAHDDDDDAKKTFHASPSTLAREAHGLEKQQQLELTLSKLKTMLEAFGEYPSRYRLVIW
jgi:hypothetical protein